MTAAEASKIYTKKKGFFDEGGLLAALCCYKNEGKSRRSRSEKRRSTRVDAKTKSKRQSDASFKVLNDTQQKPLNSRNTNETDPDHSTEIPKASRQSSKEKRYHEKQI